MQFSIIIPVYNTEKFIVKCLESIMNQTYKIIEIIIINDGSTDECNNIIHKLSTADCRIRYFKRKNHGISDTRNFGISKATGDYILFVDSDDWIERELLTIVNKTIFKTDSDVIRFQSNIISEQNLKIGEIKARPFTNIPGKEALKEFINNDQIFGPNWLYCFSKNFWTKNKFKFLSKSLQEDIGLTPYILFKASSITSIDYLGYNYFQRSDSIMRKNDYKIQVQKAFDLIKHFDILMKKINCESDDLEFNLKFKNHMGLIVKRKIKYLKEPEKAVFLNLLKRRNIYEGSDINE